MPATTIVRPGVAEARREAGLTQAGLAEAANIDRVTVARIEAGALTPSVSVALRIADALGVTVESLWGVA